MGDLTTNRGYRKPTTTDSAASLTSYWRNLADDVDADVQAIIATYLTPVKNTDPGTIAVGFTVSSVLTRTLMGGKDIYLKIDVVNTSTITPTTNNITDTTIYTLDAAYRPTEVTSSVFSANPGTGEVQINSDGTVVLRTADATISAASNIRMVFKYTID